MSTHLDEIEALIQLAKSHDLAELTVETEAHTVHIKTALGVSVVAAAPVATSAAVTQAPSTTAPAAEAPAPVPVSNNYHQVTSPMVGTMYHAPAPDADPFVTVGSRVSKGQTLCIIEAMKLMNELEADVSGVVKRIAVDNGQPVEFGQVLFEIDTE